MDDLINTFKLYNLENYIVIIDNNNDDVLVIEKLNFKIYQKKYENIKQIIKSKEFFYFEFILGIIQIKKLNFLIIWRNAKFLNKLWGNKIFLVNDVKFVNLNIINYEDEVNLENSLKYLKKLKNYLIKGFYFSLKYKLYLSINDQIDYLNENNVVEENNDINKIIKIKYINKALPDLSLSEDDTDLQEAITSETKVEIENNYFVEFETLEKEDIFKFIWNLNILKIFKLKNLDKKWFVGIIQGYINFETEKSKEINLDYIIIYRRSYELGGTRFNNRGINKNGFTSNFVEVENILINKSFIYSIISLRGSVPLFWKQISVNSEFKFYKSKEENINALNNHFKLLEKKAKNIIFINLLQEKNTNEKKLSNNFNYFVNLIKNENIFLINFDFHDQIKNNNLNSIKDLFTKIFNSFTDGYYSVIYNNDNKLKLIKKQTIIFRVNCLDSLDRTNYIQMIIKLYFLSQIYCNNFDKFKVMDNFLEFFESFKNNDYKISTYKDYYKFHKNKLILILKNNFIQGGNIISYFYTGTFSTTSEQIKKNKNSLKNVISKHLIGIQRFYKNNFKDEEKQKVINILLNKRKYTDNIKTNESIFTVISHNWKGNKNNLFFINDILNLLNYFFKEKNLIIFTYQNINKKNFKLYKEKEDNYLLFNELNNLFQYVIEKYNKDIKIIYSEKSKSNSTGLIILNNLENIKFKVIKKIKKMHSFLDDYIIYSHIFEINNCNICLLNVYFNSKAKLLNKIKKLVDILKELNKLKENFLYLFCGYFNSNIIKKFSEEELSKEINFEEISKYDEIIFNKYFNLNLIEGKINFNPTNSYFLNSDLLNPKKKIKWGNRIIWYYNKNYTELKDDFLNILDYNIYKDLFGIHKTIYCKFKINSYN